MAGRHRKPPSRHHRGRHRQPTSNARWIAPTLATVAVLAAGGISAYAALNGGSAAGPAAAPPSAVATTTSASATPITSPPSATPTPTDSRPRPAPVPRSSPRQPAPALQLVVTGQVSWVEVTRADGRVLFSGLLRHGHRLAYRSGPLHVVVGDAGAVRLDRHGRSRAPLGRPGQVVRLTVR